MRIKKERGRESTSGRSVKRAESLHLLGDEKIRPLTVLFEDYGTIRVTGGKKGIREKGEKSQRRPP